MTVSTVNYKETHFPYPDLTRIVGTPTYDTLHTLIPQLKANALSVHFTLRGGQHGHLGLLLNQQTYSLISVIPYVRPPYPPPPVFPPFLTDQQVANIKSQYKEQLHIFHKVIGVERALIQQITNSIDEPYLKAVKNRLTGQYTGTA